jgi:hypothetical protein
MDSRKKRTAISGIKKVKALLRCLENLTDRMISVIIQDRLRNGTNTKRYRSRVNPESIRLNPKSRSNLPPRKRINGNWVKKNAMPLKIFSFSSYEVNLIVRKYALFFFIRQNSPIKKPLNDCSEVHPDFPKLSEPNVSD